MKLIYLLFFFLTTGVVAFAQQWEWAKNVGGDDREEGKAIAADKNGNVYVAGTFESSQVKFGAIVLNKTGTYSDIFLAKYDSIGNALWAKSAIGDYGDISKGVAVDTAGNIYVAGEFDSAMLIFEEDTLINAGVRNIFITKYDPNGTVIWAKQAGGNMNDHATGIATDKEGGIYLTGYFRSDTAYFDSIAVPNTCSWTSNMLLAKYDSDGNVVWVKSHGDSLWDNALSIATDKNNNVIITGRYGKQFVFGNDTLNPIGTWKSEICILKYDSDGNGLWARSSQGIANGSAWNVCTDDMDNIILTGWFYSSLIDFDGKSLSAANGSFFIVKYDANGNSIWAINEGPAVGDTWGFDVTTDPSGNIYCTGQYHGDSISFGNIILTNNAVGYSGSNAFLVKYDNNGNVIWAICPKNNSFASGYALTLDSKQDIFVTGYFTNSNSIVFNDTLKSEGELDMFIAKVSVVETGIEDLVNSNFIKIFPNPSSGIFSVNLNHQDAKICIYDLLGHIIMDKEYHNQPNLELDLSDQAKGIYFIQYVVGEERIVKKVVVD